MCIRDSYRAFPYNETIIIAVVWDELINTYSSAADTTKYSDFNIVVNGGFYNENDGDAGISTYSTRPSDDGYFTINLEENNNIIYGNFEFTVIKNSRNNSFSRRIGQDTLKITNGEFRLMLNDNR